MLFVVVTADRCGTRRGWVLVVIRIMMLGFLLIFRISRLVTRLTALRRSRSRNLLDR